jgi:hypothetical protein
MKNCIETQNAMLPPRQQRALEAEKKFAKAMIKIADRAKESDDPRFDTELALALHAEHTFVLGQDPLAARVLQRRKELAHA